MDDVYQQIHQLLKEGNTVLFSGCGCHIAGLRAFLGKEFERLFTVDLLCHGVPSGKMLKAELGSRCEICEIESVDFRPMERGLI